MMNAWSYSSDENRLAHTLNVTAALLVLLSVVMLTTPFFHAPPFWLTNTTAGFLMLAFLAWFAAGDVRRFRVMIYALIGSLLIGTAGFAVMYLRAADSLLLIGFLISAGAALLLAWLSNRAKTPEPHWRPWIADKSLTTGEQMARIFFAAFGVMSLTGAAINLIAPFMAIPALSVLWSSPFLLAGSAIKLGALGLCSLIVSLDVRRFSQDVQIIAAIAIGNVASLLVISLVALLGLARFDDFTINFNGTLLTRDQMMLGAWVLDLVVIGLLLLMNNQINRALFSEFGFLTPTQFRAMEGIAETLIAGEGAEILEPYQIVLRVDHYLKSFQSGRLRLAQMAVLGLQLSPLVWFMPPITYLNPATRQDFINTRFKKEILAPSPLYNLLDSIVHFANIALLRLNGRSPEEAKAALTFTGLLEAMMRFNMQLVYLGYYSNPVVWPRQENGSGIGYVPFSSRAKDFDITPLRPHPPLNVMTPEVLEHNQIDFIRDADVVIIGSGAAGAILAEQLANKGRRVLLLEKGRYVQPDDFTEDEVEMISTLYGDGALQIAQSLRFTILQGSCVGGSTVINNAVCFSTPQRVVDAWNARHATPAIDQDRFYAAQAQVKQRMRIRDVAAGTRQPLDAVLNHGDSKMTDAVKQYFTDKPTSYNYNIVQANIVDCLGCGYCNIGCKYGRKLSMLDEVLPAAQHLYGTDHFRVISEANVVRLEHFGTNVTKLHVKVGSKRNLIIEYPNTVIVSAGTIASSWLLMQSGIGAGKLPVGQGLSFNMGSPLHALFDEELNSYDGLQISHYLEVQDQPFVYETWYNPPVAQALAMPGWLDTHFKNMQMYSHMAAVGVLVGTESNARLVPALLTGGPDIAFQPTADDLKKLVDALVLLGDIFFAGGAREVYASTRSYQSYRNKTAVYSAQSQLDRLRELVQHDYDILLGTGHPQGGNAIGVSPANSVIGPDFKVFGFDNLYVCDASIFPSSTTVNPQLTVMTMAHYASEFIH